MNGVEELEQLLTLDQAREVADSHLNAVVENNRTTQQLLDELLGRFEDDDSTMFLTHGFTSESCPDSDE